MNDSAFDNTTEASATEHLPALVGATHPMATLLNPGAYQQLKNVARHFAASQLVPQHFRGKPHDCFLALHMAYRLGCDPILVLQNLYVVHGQPGWSAKFIIGQANLSNVFKGRIRYRYEGDDANLKVTAYAELADTGDTVEAEASMAMAKAEGWTKNAKYQTMPRQMLSYRAATLLVRLYAPEVLLGVPTVDEVVDVAASKGKPAPPAYDSGTEALKAALKPEEEAEVIEADVVEEEVIEEASPETWPKQTDAGNWVDSAGEVFDRNRHGWSHANDRPAICKDGTFRARRGSHTDATVHGSPSTPPPPEPDSAPFTVDFVAKAIRDATTEDELAEAEDLCNAWRPGSESRTTLESLLTVAKRQMAN